MFSPRTTPKDELTGREVVTTVLRHTIEGPINGAENRPWGRDLWLQEPHGFRVPGPIFRPHFWT